MKKIFAAVLFWECLTAGVWAGISNEWTFEADLSGRILAETVNSGTGGAQFSAGGAGFLETDGTGGLLCTHDAAGTNGMWNSGAVLDANLASSTSGVQYLRYDFQYRIGSLSNNSGTVLGLMFTDGTGTDVVGISFQYYKGAGATPTNIKQTAVVTGLSSNGTVSVVVKVNMDSRLMDVWYSLSGSPVFNESSPSQSGVPFTLSSISKLRLQATGDFRPAGSTDYARIEAIRTASTWIDITATVCTNFSVHSVFHSGAVLQRNIDIPVWGWGTPGALLTLRMDGILAATAVIDANGRWLTRIGSYDADGGAAHRLDISAPGAPAVSVTNIIFGDVYLGSGQSNMGRKMRLITGVPNEAAAADYPLIRQVEILSEADTVKRETSTVKTVWTGCSSITVSNFSGVCYFFAKNVHLQTGVPIGIILASYDGQEVQRFLNPAGVSAVPELSGIQQDEEQGGLSNYYDVYNAMIAPLTPYGIRGFLWYQGEANRADGDIYQYKMQALMRGWRQEWEEGDIPFYYVQLPNYVSTGNSNWAEQRDVQRRVLSETNCGMAVTIDVGDDNDIHPANKQDPGYRLAQWALAKIYGKNRTFSGPLYLRSETDGSALRIVFDYADSGLFAGIKNGTNPVVQMPNGDLQNFEIAGSNRVFVAAQTHIDADSIVVSNTTVANPVYVRYCHKDIPSGSNKLYNAAGLPASPFHTDISYRLDVVTDSGVTTTTLFPGSTQAISAGSPPSGKVFDRWIGAASEVGNLNAASTTVTMPDRALYLLASYRDIAAPVYTLTVNNGFGSGASKYGSILNIEAGPPPTGQTFDRWTGDTQAVVNVSAAVTTLRMPTNNVTVTAVFCVVDSVGDGIPDSWRAIYFPEGVSTNSAANADPDGDGFTNGQEYIAGTSPRERGSVLRLNGLKVSGNSINLSFASITGHRYRLEFTRSLTAPVWETLIHNITGDGFSKTLSPDVTTETEGFVRLRVSVQE